MYLINSHRFSDFVQYGLYSESEFDAFIADGYIPVSTEEEFNNIALSTLEFMGSECPKKYQGNYVTGGDKKYIQYKPISFTEQVDIIEFEGDYNGNLTALDNVDISPVASGYALFSCTSTTGIRELNNIIITNGLNNNTTAQGLALLARFAADYSINNCHVQGAINSVGGTAQSGARCGGIAGTSGADINNCSANVIINSTYSLCGALVGYAAGGTITNCHAKGSVIVNETGLNGGLVGYNLATITNCYSIADAQNGLSGNDNGGITSSYYNTDITPVSAGGEGKSTLEMKQQATYVGWDFTNIWKIEEGIDYPELR